MNKNAFIFTMNSQTLENTTFQYLHSLRKSHTDQMTPDFFNFSTWITKINRYNMIEFSNEFVNTHMEDIVAEKIYHVKNCRKDWKKQKEEFSKQNPNISTKKFVENFGPKPPLTPLLSKNNWDFFKDNGAFVPNGEVHSDFVNAIEPHKDYLLKNDTCEVMKQFFIRDS